MTHTPGPWSVKPWGINSANEAIIVWEGLTEANARLIAAAPELLAALKFAAEIIGHPDDDGSKFIAGIIAKAEGKP